MRVSDQLRNTDVDISIVLPGADALIYEEVQSGTSWYEAGRIFGLEGARTSVSGRARRMAGTYARNYRKVWPLDDVDVLSQEEDARVEKARLEKLREEARVEKARLEKLQAARILEETHRVGKLLYEQRLITQDWSAIAKVVGFPYRHSKKAAMLYAKAYKLPWPVLTERHDCGEVAYTRRLEKKEPWPVIAEVIGRAVDHTRKAAHGYALASGKPWPLILKDYGAEAYHFRYVEGLSWEEVAEKCHISRSWAVREADKHKASLPAPLPSPNDTTDIDERTYELRAQGKGWKEVRAILKCSASVAVERASRHAHATGKPWPVDIPPVRTTHSPKAKAAYERGYVAGEPWEEVATSLGYTSVASAKTSARCYADRCKFSIDIRRRRASTRVNDRPQRSYEHKLRAPADSWDSIGASLGYPSVQSAHTAARSWAKKQGLLWPLPGESNG